MKRIIYNKSEEIIKNKDEYLDITIPICPLNNGKFNIPKNIKKIWFDIGTSLNSPNGAQFLKRNKDGFCIGFEPCPKMYFTIYSLNLINKNKWLVDREHPTARIESEKRKSDQKRQIFNDTEEFIEEEDFLNRYIFIPTSVGTKEGIQNLYDNVHHGSFSLRQDWVGTLKKKKMRVNMLPLKIFIDMVPDNFYIEHVKIDCEGSDIDVIKSAGDSIKRVAVITVESDDALFFKTINFQFLEKQNGGTSYINKNFLHIKNKLDYFIRV